MIDWNRVEELRSDFGEDDFVEIVALFLDEVEGKLAEMSVAPQSDLPDGFHFLKGSAANLGFRALHEATSAAEASPCADKLTEIAQIFAMSKTTFLDGVNADQSVA